MGGLGRFLGAFGKTNAAEVSGNLWKQYGDIQENLLKNKKDMMLLDLRKREDARAEAEMNMKVAEYNKKHELKNWDDIAKKVGYEKMTKRMKEQYIMRGWIDPKTNLVERQYLEMWPQVAQDEQHNADLWLGDMIDGTKEKILEFEKQKQGFTAKTDPALVAEVEKNLEKYRNQRDNLESQRQAVSEFAAKKKKEMGIADPTGMMAEADRKKKLAEADKARAEATTATILAQQASADFSAGKRVGDGKTEKSPLTPAAAKSLAESVNDVVAVRMLDQVNRERVLASGKPLTGKDGVQIVQELSKDPEAYALYQQIHTETQRLWEQYEGLHDPTSVALEAYDNVMTKVYKQKMEASLPDEQGNMPSHQSMPGYVPPAASNPTGFDQPQGDYNRAMWSKRAKAEAEKKMATPPPAPPSGKKVTPDAGDEEMDMERATVLIPMRLPKGGGVYLVPPSKYQEGEMSPKEVMDLNDAIDKARKAGKSEEFIINILKTKHGWKEQYLKPEHRPAE